MGRPLNSYLCSECREYTDTDIYSVDCPCGAILHAHGTTPGFVARFYKSVLEDVVDEHDKLIFKMLDEYSAAMAGP